MERPSSDRVGSFIWIMIIASGVFGIPALGSGDGVDRYGSPWTPFFYEESHQEDRNICIGLILFESNPGVPGGPDLDDSYSIYYDINGSMGEDQIILKDYSFASQEPLATAAKSIDGVEYPVYFYVVSHLCLPDANTKYGYSLIEKPYSWLDREVCYKYIDYISSNRACDEDQSICSTFDLDPFYEWAAKPIDFDDDPSGEDDDDDETPVNTDDDDNNDDSDDGQCGGCASSNGKFSLPLALGMFLIGLFAWGVARKRSEG